MAKRDFNTVDERGLPTVITTAPASGDRSSPRYRALARALEDYRSLLWCRVMSRSPWFAIGLWALAALVAAIAVLLVAAPPAGLSPAKPQAWVAVLVAIGATAAACSPRAVLRRIASGARTRLRAAPPVCPACAYDMAGLEPDVDGCTACPECGGAWRFPPL